jgi:hypothetical protein
MPLVRPINFSILTSRRHESSLETRRVALNDVGCELPQERDSARLGSQKASRERQRRDVCRRAIRMRGAFVGTVRRKNICS